MCSPAGGITFAPRVPHRYERGRGTFPRMELELHPSVVLESGTFGILIAPGEAIVPPLDRLLEELERFLVLYVCGNYSRLLSCIHRRHRNFEIRRSFTAFQLLQILSEARHTLVFIEYDPTLFEEGMELERSLPRACRDVAQHAIVLLYSPAMDRHLHALAREADRVFYLGTLAPRSPGPRAPPARVRRLPRDQRTLEAF